MAVAFVRNHGAEFVKAAGTTDVYSLTADVTVGNLLVAVAVFDNAATASKPVISSISKAAGETNNWVFLGAARSTSTSSGAFSSGEIWVIKTTVTWPNATSLTFTWDTSITMKAQDILEFSGCLATLRSTVGTAYSATTTAASAATTGTTPSVGDLAVGLIFGSNAATPQAGDTDTTGGAWITPAGVGSTGGNVATNNYGIVPYKILSSAAHQTLNNSAAMTAGNGAIVAVLQQYVPPAITQAAYRLYADGTETGATALANQDTGYTANVSAGDVNLAVRILAQSTNAVAIDATDDFQLEWERNASGTWNKVISAVNLADSYPDSNWAPGGSFGLSSTRTENAQSFLGDGNKLLRAGFYVQRDVSPDGTISAALYAHTGTFGSTGTPFGAALATSTTTMTAASLSQTRTWLYFDFDGTVTLAAGMPYFIAITSSITTAVPNTLTVGGDDTSSAHGGNAASKVSGSWAAAATMDLMFEVYTGPEAVSVLADNCSPGSSDGSTELSSSAGDYALGQSFTGDGGNLVKADFWAGKFGTPPGNVSAELYAHSGAFGTSSIPTGSPLATSTPRLATSLTTTPVWESFTFDSTLTLTDGTNYVIVLTVSTIGDTSNYVVGGRNSAAGHAGNRSRRDSVGTWFAIGSSDHLFRIYETDTPPVLPYASANLTDAAATTSRLTGGSGSFVAGKISEDGRVDNLTWTANNYTELLYSVTLKAADLADADVLRFRVARYDSTGAKNLLTYTQTPTITASITPPIPATATDPIGITDSIAIEKTIVKDVTDVASSLRDGGGINILGIESSFETDTNLDGIADGWRVPGAAETGSWQVPDAVAIVAAPSGGHGASGQSITRNPGGAAKPAQLYSTAIAVNVGTRVHFRVRAYNPTASPVTAYIGFVHYNASDTRVDNTNLSQSVGAGASATVSVSGPVASPTAQTVRAAIGVSDAVSGTLVFDSVRVFERSANDAFTPTYDYYDPANRITFVPGAVAFTHDASDTVGLTDSVSYELGVEANSIFYPSIPAGVNANVDAAVSLGTAFQTSQSMSVTALHFWLPGNATTADRTVGLYLTTGVDTGSLLYSATVTPVAGAWNTHTLPDPVSVSTGTQYKVVVWHPANSVYPSTGDYFTSAFTDGPLTFFRSDDIAEGNGTYGYGSSLAYPTEMFNRSNYWNDVSVVPAVGGAALTLDVSDNTGLVDSVATARVATYSAADTVGLLDSRSTEVGIVRAEATGLVDARSLAVDLARSDTEALTDALTVGTFAIAATDPVNLTDSVLALKSGAVTLDLSDQVGVIDSRALAVTADRADAIALTDSRVAGASFAVSLADAVGLTDARSLEAGLSRADPVALTDAASRIGTLDRSDGTGLVDSRALAAALDRADPVPVLDASALARALAVDLSDRAGLTDVLGVGTFAVNFSDLAGLTDSTSVTAAGATNLDLSDVVGVHDSVLSTGILLRNFADVIGLTDVRVAEVILARSDPIGLLDTRVISVLLSRSDTEALLDSQALAYVLNRVDTEFVSDAVLASIITGVTGWPKTWNGSAWVSKPAKVWNGSAWVTKPVKVWTGSAWKVLT